MFFLNRICVPGKILDITGGTELVFLSAGMCQIVASLTCLAAHIINEKVYVPRQTQTDEETKKEMI